MTPLAAALLGIVYGAAHGLGPDHLTALAALMEGSDDRRRAFGACVRFGLSHAVVLGALGALAAASGWLVPEAWEQAAEAAGGAILVALGIFALVEVLPLLVHRHAHTHDEDQDEAAEPPHEHWHVHVGDPARHRHGHPAMVGGVMALSGVRALAIAVSPLLLAGRSPASALAFLLSFGLGVVASMLAFAPLFQAGRRVLGRHVTALGIGGASVVVGGWWIWTSLA